MKTEVIQTLTTTFVAHVPKKLTFKLIRLVL